MFITKFPETKNYFNLLGACLFELWIRLVWIEARGHEVPTIFLDHNLSFKNNHILNEF